MYFKLFSASADAVDALEHADIRKALQLLISAQQQTEELYISDS